MKTAAYPDHPDDIVINKSELLAGAQPITELDVYNYYSGVIGKMLPELKERNLFVAIKLEGTLKKGDKPLYVRHPHDGKTEFIRINNKEQFEDYHTGRTVEYHVTMNASCPYYVVDFDGMPDGDFEKTKNVTGEVADKLNKHSDVKKVEIRYSGKRGFHILGWLKKEKPVDIAREDLKEWLKNEFSGHKDLIVAETAQGSKGALGVSPMKLNGGQVALWSLRVTGLCCVEVPRNQLDSFKRDDATIDVVYKKLSGKSFSWNKGKAQKIKRMAMNIVTTYLSNKEALS